ncbi:cysteine--tRNA ligase [Bavariicoccus seileri]|uniref:cysteine--tRNA ligase n=1 Tax=Bavariicoccus seileri TaxID=549685 RepID=UPI003F933A77
MIQVFNTLTNKREVFKPINPDKVTMYVCGPTVYNYIHIGNARSAVAFDTIRRYLQYRGYRVAYVSNFTDVDDKVIRVARETQTTPKEVADKYIAAFKEDVAQLGIEEATANPRVIDNIPDIISFIEALIEKGYAYEAKGDVYFRTSKFKDYGKLSDQSIKDLRAGASERTATEDDRKKENILDFALWKAAKPGEISWYSPWGKGRPGWHIECSVMATKYLGDTIDIHAGGHDLTFPHHENEIAQSEAKTGKPFAHYWLHNGFVTADDGEKMSKSLGNFTLVHDLIKNVDPKVVRFFLVSAQYRHPIVFNDKAIKEAKAVLDRFKNTEINGDYRVEQLKKDEAHHGHVSPEEAADYWKSYKEGFIVAMDDDFNTPNAIAKMIELSKAINNYLDDETGQEEIVSAGLNLLTTFLGILGIHDLVPKQLLDEDIQQLIDDRLAARKAKDFARSDAIRDELKEQGIILEDTAQGTRWKRDSDA